MKTERQYKQAIAAKEAAHAVLVERLQRANNELQAETQRCQEELEYLHSQLKQHHENYTALERLLSTANTECDKLRKLLVLGETSYNAEQRAHLATRLAVVRIARQLFEATSGIDNIGRQLLDATSEPTPDSEDKTDA
jgi:chromosome segregation ATPase